MLSKLTVAVLLTTTQAQDQVFATDDAQTLENGGLRLGFLNDIHYEPEYDTKAPIKIASKKHKLRLVKAMKALSADEQWVQEKLFGQMHQMFMQYFLRPDRFSTLKFQWNSKVKQMKRERSSKAVENVMAVVQDLFDNKAHYAHFELCDYIENMVPDNRIQKSRFNLKNCNIDHGFSGMDSPLRLINLVSNHMAENAKPNAVIMNGDFVGHYRALKSEPESIEVYTNQVNKHLAITKAAFDKIRANLGPGAPLLPSIGNNDVPVHNLVPCNEQQHDVYYKGLFDVFFPADAQPAGFNAVEAQKTFHAGGYYRYDFPNSQVSLLSVNTMFFKGSNRCGAAEADVMLEWLKQQFAGNVANRNFVLSMHVYPGLNDFEGVQRFWKKGYANRFLAILNEGKQHVAFMTGAHIHLNRQSAPSSANFPELHVPIFVSHAVSPVYMGNPSYSQMDLSVVDGKAKFDNVQINSYDLMAHATNMKHNHWEVLDPLVEFGIDYNKPETLIDLFPRYNTPELFGRSKGFAYGQDKVWRNIFLGEIFYPKYLQTHPGFPAQHLCPSMWYQVSQP